MDQETKTRFQEDLKRAFSDPLTPEELAQARALAAEDLEQQAREHQTLQHRRPGAVRNRILTPRPPTPEPGS